MLKLIRLASFALLALIGGLWAHAWLTRAEGEGVGEAFAARVASVFGQSAPVPSAGGVQLPAGIVLGGAFSLVDQDGRAVTERDFAGRFLLVYFGFTWCPDVCPTELGTIASAMDELGADAARVTPVLITIDPQRDTPEVMREYVARFHPRLVGLTGTPEQVAEVARRYRVYFARAQRPDLHEYLMDHSSFVYLVGPDSLVRAMFRPETSPEAMAAAVRGQLRSATGS